MLGGNMKEFPFETLNGLVLEKLEESKDRDEVRITASGREFLMKHDQDCCESVRVESIKGDISRALGETIIDATENSNSGEGEGAEPKLDEWDESWTWTYYTIRTQSETIVIRWYGTSNGYYSERVDFYEV
jgi:hypothetical protein